MGSPLGWSRAVGLAACHCCHDQHHLTPARSSVVVMAMTVYLRGGTLRLQCFPLGGRETQRDGERGRFKGQVDESVSCRTTGSLRRSHHRQRVCFCVDWILPVELFTAARLVTLRHGQNRVPPGGATVTGPAGVFYMASRLLIHRNAHY